MTALSNFRGMIASNVGNENLSDKEFRRFVLDTLDIVDAQRDDQIRGPSIEERISHYKMQISSWQDELKKAEAERDRVCSYDGIQCRNVGVVVREEGAIPPNMNSWHGHAWLYGLDQYIEAMPTFRDGYTAQIHGLYNGMPVTGNVRPYKAETDGDTYIIKFEGSGLLTMKGGTEE
jgi:hypothetical protein